MFRRALLVAVALLSTLTPFDLPSAGTTTASAATFTYDAAAVARNELQGVRASTASRPLLDVAPDRSVSPLTVALGTSTTSLSRNNATNSSDVLLNSSKQLQSKFKHAGDFGVAGNYSKANAAKYSEALNQHINSPAVTKISGTYRGDPVTHFLDPATGLNVIVDPNGAFVSGWKLGPAQLQNVLSHGGLT